MFNCTRVPGTEGLDWSVLHTNVGDTHGDGYVVVLRNGHFWRLDAAQMATFSARPNLRRLSPS